MTGFSTDWLDLREPVDHAARDRPLLAQAADLLASRDRPLVVDLGCGTGSTLRALTPHLTGSARWRFVDNDPALLAAVASRTAGLDVACTQADLRDIDALEIGDADLVTASALFDLVSEGWVRELAAKAGRHDVAVYAALNFDGRIEFDAAHPLDGAVCAAFVAHQGGDKGFGPALGPHAPGVTADLFRAAGFRVATGDSPWRLRADELGRQFVDGVAGAVRETGLVAAGDLAAWRAFRVEAPACLVGHRDVLAVPDRF